MIRQSEFIFSHIITHVLKHPKTYVALALITTILATFVLVTRFDVRSDLKDLMPEDARSVEDTFKISERVGSISTLQIIIETPDLELNAAYKETQNYRDCLREFSREGRELLGDIIIAGDTWCDNALVAFARDFSKELEALDIIGNVQFHNDKEFFEKNILLYANEAELEQAYTLIDEMLTEARKQSGEYKACLITATEENECEALEPSLEKVIKNSNYSLEAPSQTTPESSPEASSKAEESQTLLTLMESQLLDRYKNSELSNVKEFPVYQLADGAWVLKLIVRFKDPSTSLKAIQGHVARISQVVEKINPKNYHKDLIIDYGGALKDMQNEYNAIVKDIAQSIALTIFNIFLLISIFFRSARVGIRILFPLIMGTTWTLAITFLTIGYLNLITAFIFAILLGLGIDYGIHLYARFILERREGKETREAMVIAVVETGTPIFFGTLTTVATFFTLLLSGFQGFSQFGLVAGIGVLISFLSTITIMPAITLIFEGIRPTRLRKTNYWRPTQWGKSKPKQYIAIAISLSLLALVGYGVYQMPNLRFEENFYNLQLKNSQDNATQDRYSTAKSTSRHSSPAVIIFDSIEEVSAFQMEINRRSSSQTLTLSRKLATSMPNTFQNLNAAIYPLQGYLKDNNSFIITDLAMRVLPKEIVWSLPISKTYSPETGKVMRLSKKIAIQYPEFMHELSHNLLPEILEQSFEWVAFKRMDWIAQMLPPWARASLPDNRPSDKLSTVKETASIYSYMPGTELEQLRKMNSIAKINERISDRNIRFLPQSEKDKIASFKHHLVDKTVNIDDLPLWVKLQFKESGLNPHPPRPDSGLDFAFGNIALLYQYTSTYYGPQAHQFTDEVRSLRMEGEPIVAATGAFIYSDILRLVQTDGVRIAFIALALVILIVFIQQRAIFATLIVTLPLVSAVILSLLTMVALDLKLGIFNMVIIPVILGIGIDASIYLYQRYCDLGRGSCFVALREVGSAIFMSSATTLVGFGTMVMSQHMGLNTMGQLSIIGVGLCFLATTLILPGLILIAEKLKIKSAIPKFDYDPQIHEKE